MSQNAIVVKNLKKSFGSLHVLKDITFSATKGEILALLGPNGAGKTTTINILSTLLIPDGGNATIAGFNVVEQGDKVRASIGLTGQFAAVDEYLTGRENITLIGRLYHLPQSVIDQKSSELIKKFDLDDAADRPARTYSGGMKRRLDLAMSLIADPPVLFLDEPTTGLDPRSRLTLWNMIKELANSGTTVLLTTQYMEEADFLANNIIVIDHGTIIAEGTPAQLKSKAGADTVEATFTSLSTLKKAQAVIKGTLNEDNLSLSVPSNNGVTSLKEVLQVLEKAHIKADTASLRRPTLDDVFLALTGHEATETSEQLKTDKKEPK